MTVTKEDVNAQSSGAKGADGDSSDPSNDRVMPDGRTKEDVWAENQRKQRENETLRQQVQQLLSEKGDRLSELDDKERLTEAEKEERQTLSEQIESIKINPKSKPWMALTKETSADVASQAIFDYDKSVAERDAKKFASEFKMTEDEFDKIIVKFVRLTDPKRMPTVRLEEAVELLRERLEFEKEKKDAMEKSKTFADGGGHTPTEPNKKLSKEEAINRGFSNDTELAGMLGSVAKRQQKERENKQ